MSVVTIGPQPGPQTQFLACTADIAIYGGAAGGGKSYAMLLEPLRHYNNSKFSGVIFRRNTVQVRNPGGLWDESYNMYKQFRGHPREGILEWTFPSGAALKFSHLEHVRSVLDWQGAQIPFIGFDELTHFTEYQFFYMLSRNRSTSGVKSYIRATTNPDSESWVRKLIDWWIGPDGFPIPERSGVVRWFIRIDDELIWADTSEELTNQYGTDQIPKSFTFIPSSIHDNKILMDKDPGYLSSLMALARVERLRLLGGNWNVRPTAGSYFQKEWFPIVKAIPSGWSRIVRYWDRAATVPNEQNPNPDWTAGVKLYSYPDGRCLVASVVRERNTPLNIQKLIFNTASHDGQACHIYIEEEPGSSGVADADAYVRLLRGYVVHKSKPTRDKGTRALPVSAQAEAGNILVLEAPWNDAFFKELESFEPEGTSIKTRTTTNADAPKDDQVDGLSGSFNESVGTPSMLDFYRRK